ncbi:MAG: biotin synthase BioB [Candidatus Omnitrophica bacterium]|nr:biotin synthase BioB [Candidatus Omnitrophota bacterium]MDD5653916.1 biotin synthase BioB [Candidatus Omnitrophota bacterium]
MLGKDIKALLKLPLRELILQANSIRQEFLGKKLDLCNILNAKSGLCAQNCKFCAQASRHATGIETYALKPKTEIIAAARRAKEIGAQRFGIVTSGDRLSVDELERIADTVQEITQKIKIKACASLGSMNEKEFKLLKKAGLSRYHHNLETGPGFFPKIVTTHTFSDRIRTIKAARASGLEVCSGGIIGMGETMQDRIEMALTLKELNVDSVPINVLVPIKGTPLGKQPQLSSSEAIRTIAIFRIILKDKTVKVAAGRETALKDFQALVFLSGANGMLIGGYLTIKGRDLCDDQKLIEEIKLLWNA